MAGPNEVDYSFHLWTYHLRILDARKHTCTKRSPFSPSASIACCCLYIVKSITLHFHFFKKINPVRIL